MFNDPSSALSIVDDNRRAREDAVRKGAVVVGAPRAFQIVCRDWLQAGRGDAGFSHDIDIFGSDLVRGVEGQTGFAAGGR